MRFFKFISKLNSPSATTMGVLTALSIIVVIIIAARGDLGFLEWFCVATSLGLPACEGWRQVIAAKKANSPDRDSDTPQ